MSLIARGRAPAVLCRLCSLSPGRSAPSLRKRLVATQAAPLAPQPIPSPTADALHRVQQLLERHPTLLPREVWAPRLQRAAEDLVQVRRARIAVIGDAENGTSALVTSMLDDPLSQDEDLSVALASRHVGGKRPEATVITYAGKTQSSASQLALPSTFLRDNKLDLIEVFADGSKSSFAEDALLASDIVLLHLTTDAGSDLSIQDLVYNHPEKPNLFFSLDSLDTAPPTSIPESLLVELSFTSPLTPTILPVSTRQAMRGLEALAPDDPNVPISYGSFQKDFSGSGVPALMERLRQAVADGLAPPLDEPAAPSQLQLETARYALSQAIFVIEGEVQRIEQVLEEVAAETLALSVEGQRQAEAVLEDLGVTDRGWLKVPKEDLKESMGYLERLFQSRLAWWKLPFRTDDLTTEIAAVVQDSYLRNFEDRLIFDTGRLISLSSTLSARTDELFATPAFQHDHPGFSPLSSFYSPVLFNRIDQAALEGGKIASTELSAPLVHRRRQIVAPGGPTEVLQARAQQAVLSASSFSLGSIGAGTLSHVVEFADLATNVGFGMLGTVAAAWWLQRGWTKATGKFFVDVEKRITGGLEDDLGMAAQRIVDRSTFKLRTAVLGTQDLLQRRREKLGDIVASLAAVENFSNGKP